MDPSRAFMKDAKRVVVKVLFPLQCYHISLLLDSPVFYFPFLGMRKEVIGIFFLGIWCITLFDVVVKMIDKVLNLKT